MAKRSLPVALLLILNLSQVSRAQNIRAGEPDWKKTGEESVELLSNYLRVDTTNPPGNEARAANFFARILEREGITYTLFESAPGRSILYARLKGSGGKRALVLLNHTDVVPAEKQFWSSDPFGALVRDGNLIGRGALDMKSMGAAQFMAFVLLKRSGIQLARDVVFLATPDEEAGGRAGPGWLVQNHPELLRDCEFLITEGSSNLVVGDRRIYYGIGVTEKTPCWLKLTARGTAGHGSVPKHDSAPSRLLRALGKLEAYQPAIKAVPAVARYFRALAELQSDAQLKRAYSDVAAAANDPKLRDLIVSNSQNVALLSNTIQPTVVTIGTKTNVIAPIATAEVDCRLLPGERPDDFVAEIRKVIDDSGIEIEKLLSFSATESPIETDLYRSVAEVIRADDPNAVFVPTVLTGFTDSHYFRDLGIVSYGFSPFLIQSQDYVGVHGNDERIPVAAVGPGVQLLYRIVRTFCTAQDLSATMPGKR